MHHFSICTDFMLKTLSHIICLRNSKSMFESLAGKVCLILMKLILQYRKSECCLKS